jgi:hypothetical protein
MIINTPINDTKITPNCPCCDGKAMLHDSKIDGPDRFMIYCAHCGIRITGANKYYVQEIWSTRKAV